MDDNELLTRRFEADRTHLRAVAYRMLGSVSEADDAVQEAWLRLHRSDTSGVDNLSGWLTTVVSRVCLDLLRSRSSRREEPLGMSADRVAELADPAESAVQADSVGLALLVVLETLTPPERVAFVLHDVFGVPFDEVAPVLDRSPAAARQLASRARRRVRGAEPVGDLAARRAVVEAFLLASRGGDLSGLLALLDPDAVLRADDTAAAMGAAAELRGAEAVAGNLVGRARAARLALVDGSPGWVWTHKGVPQVVFSFTLADGRITAIDLLADATTLAEVELTFLGRPTMPAQQD